jgi:hypothetical protein
MKFACPFMSSSLCQIVLLIKRWLKIGQDGTG